MRAGTGPGNRSVRAIVVTMVTAVVMGSASLAIPVSAATSAGGVHPKVGAAGTIATIAGGVGGPGPARQVSIAPCGSAAFPVGCGLYGVAMTKGDIYTIAGGKLGTGGDGGPAIDVRFDQANGIALDGTAGLLISDQNRVRVIATATGTFFGIPMTDGDIYTIAGTGDLGVAGDGGRAIDADISPLDLTVDSAGNLVFFDLATRELRVVPVATGTSYGIAMTADHLYSIVGGGSSFPGDGGPGTSAAIANLGLGLAANDQGVAFTDGDGIRVRMVLG